MRPDPEPERSLRNHPVISGVPMFHPWMSLAVSPSPKPLSGSLLVVECNTNPFEPDKASLTFTAVVTAARLWFGGHSTFGDALHIKVGGVLSMLIPVTVVDA